jgi:hypothetical protein
VRDFWKRLIDIEDSQLPELELIGEGEAQGSGITYPCRRTGGDFDFDPLDTVDVMTADRPKSIATLDLKALSDDAVTFVAPPNWPLRKGDRIRLVSRRSRQSLDRRRRAVNKILGGTSKIRDLIECFDPAAVKEAVDYEVAIDPADLEAYDLNPGQRAAFLKVIGCGPLGLLQGPPGTGKTHFIAALVHWLTGHGKADKVLLVSQSHEAVNAALETLIDRFKAERNRLPLLRIGTKGISEKIRPYHTDSLRERARLIRRRSEKQNRSRCSRRWPDARFRLWRGRYRKDVAESFASPFRAGG